MADKKADADKQGYAPPKLSTYGDFADLTASGSGFSSEFFGENRGQRMMKRP